MFHRVHARTLLFALVCAACSGSTDEPKPPITIFAAASLARPLATLSDSFRARTGVPARRELGGSLEHVRKVSALGRIPDVILLADDEVIASLTPSHLDWYIRFATSRLVIAYTPRSRHADSVTADNWWRILTRDGVSVGRADSAIAPAGRHALTLLRRAEAYYREAGLSARLLAQSGARFIRPNATELAALLETAEVDYVLEYESVAKQFGFKYILLPADLAGTVLYGVSVPRNAMYRREGERFVTYLLSDEGKAILRGADVEVLRLPVAIGTNIPSGISDLVRTIETGPVAR